jgi:hypothetical protein
MKHYPLGCLDLIILVDFNPILGNLKNWELGEVDNLRLGAMCEKTLQWNFKIEPRAGAKNLGSDAFSWYL